MMDNLTEKIKMQGDILLLFQSLFLFAVWKGWEPASASLRLEFDSSTIKLTRKHEPMYFPPTVFESVDLPHWCVFDVYLTT